MVLEKRKRTGPHFVESSQTRKHVLERGVAGWEATSHNRFFNIFFSSSFHSSLFNLVIYSLLKYFFIPIIDKYILNFHMRRGSAPFFLYK